MNARGPLEALKFLRGGYMFKLLCRPNNYLLEDQTSLE